MWNRKMMGEDGGRNKGGGYWKYTLRIFMTWLLELVVIHLFISLKK